MYAYQLALAGWVGVFGMIAAEGWSDLGRMLALASDPVLLFGAVAIGALVRPGWLAACAVAALVAVIEWKVARDWGWRADFLGHRLVAAALLASTAATLRDLFVERLARRRM